MIFGVRGLLDAVVEEIGLRVLKETYRAGESIPSEPVLIAELSVSRTVLREAVKTLIAKGLLESRPKTGTRVRPRRDWNMLDPTILRLYCQITDYSGFAQHFQHLRLILEPEAAALAATHGNQEQVQMITSAYEAMASAENIRAWTESDVSFHQAILEASGNPFIIPLGSLIHAALETLLYQSASSSPDPFESLQGHYRVLCAITAQDAAAARNAMKDLLGHTHVAVAKTIKVRSDAASG